MTKKVICLILTLTVMFALVACNDNSDLLKRIEKLESAVQSQQDTITDLQEENKRQQGTINDLEEKAKKREEEEEWLDGRWFSLELAYDQGWLTREDIMHISYFERGYVMEGSKDDRSTWHYVDFVPEVEQPAKLNKRIELIIGSVLHDGDYIRRYYGIYSDCCVVELGNYLYEWCEDPMLYEIGGILFFWDDSPFIKVWKKN